MNELREEEKETINLNNDREEKNERENVNNALAELNDNTKKEKFLFVFVPEKLEIDFLCGCSLRTGIKIISIILLIGGIIGTISSLFTKELISTIFSVAIYLAYLVAGICMYKSTITNETSDADLGYLIYASIFIFDLVMEIIMLFLIGFGIINPFAASSNFFKSFFVYFSNLCLTELVKLYCVWISFCYKVHLNLNRHKLISLKS